MRIESQPAFVLHTRPWRETSLMVELLTRDHGRVTVIARGVSGPKKRIQRAALQPLQFVHVDYLPRGELARLVSAEAFDTAPTLSGESLLAAFYVNELLIKLCARGDAVPSVFELYARVRAELTGTGSLAWTLRRFERDLLNDLGYGLPWAQTEDGERLDPASQYRLDPEHGPIRDAQRGDNSVSGAALLALADDRLPDAELLATLRPALRGVLAAHLGQHGLKSWGMLGELARIRTRQ
jgi:DNA repair protein RecO (recombination protein O)